MRFNCSEDSTLLEVESLSSKYCCCSLYTAVSRRCFGILCVCVRDTAVIQNDVHAASPLSGSVGCYVNDVECHYFTQDRIKKKGLCWVSVLLRAINNV